MRLPESIIPLFLFIVFCFLIQSTSASTQIDSQGILWQSSDNGQLYTHQQAVHYCTNLSLDGYTDWTLPSITNWSDILANLDAYNLGDNCYWSNDFYDTQAAFLFNGSCNSSSSEIQNETPILVRCISYRTTSFSGGTSDPVVSTPEPDGSFSGGTSDPVVSTPEPDGSFSGGTSDPVALTASAPAAPPTEDCGGFSGISCVDPCEGVNQLTCNSYSDVNQLLDWAFAEFPDLLEGSSETYNFSGFWVRYYKKNNLYLGSLDREIYGYASIWDGLVHFGNLDELLKFTPLTQIDSQGILWQSSDNGQLYTHRQAVHYCTNLSLDGYTDWTLPSITNWSDILANLDAYNLGDNCYWSNDFYDTQAAFLFNGSCNSSSSEIQNDTPILVRCISYRTTSGGSAPDTSIDK